MLARIAQLVEQWIEDPRVTSSNLVPGNNHNLPFITFLNILHVSYQISI